MTVLEDLAASLPAPPNGTPAAEVVDRLELHLFDSLGAFLAGRRLPESEKVAELVGCANPRSSVPADRFVTYACAAIRATEVDDIHLPACVTPSAAIVPAILSLAREGTVKDGAGFLSACLAGHEAMIGFGMAVGGTGLLRRGIWPTHLCAGIGAAAAAAAGLRLSASETVHALAIACARTAGMHTRGSEPTSRWLTIGLAAGQGVLAARAASLGLKGDEGLLDGRWSEATGMPFDASALDRVPGDGLHFESVSIKPWCAARQTMAAGTAFRGLIEEEGITVGDIRAIRVEVPQAYAAMIDRPGLPKGRQDSFANVRYVLGMIAFAPEGLFEITRRSPRITPHMEGLARKTEVRADGSLDVHYPRLWPARVSIADGNGVRHVREVREVPGDPGTGFGWDEVAEKFARVTGLGGVEVGRWRAACEGIMKDDGLETLLDLFDDGEVQAIRPL